MVVLLEVMALKSTLRDTFHIYRVYNIHISYKIYSKSTQIYIYRSVSTVLPICGVISVRNAFLETPRKSLYLQVRLY